MIPPDAESAAMFPTGPTEVEKLLQKQPTITDDEGTAKTMSEEEKQRPARHKWQALVRKLKKDKQKSGHRGA
jgi:hypothetical protein